MKLVVVIVFSLMLGMAPAVLMAGACPDPATAAHCACPGCDGACCVHTPSGAPSPATTTAAPTLEQGPWVFDASGPTPAQAFRERDSARTSARSFPLRTAVPFYVRDCAPLL